MTASCSPLLLKSYTVKCFVGVNQAECLEPCLTLNIQACLLFLHSWLKKLCAMCLNVLSVYMYVHDMHVWYLQRPGSGRSPVIEVSVSCGLPCRLRKMNWGPLNEKQGS